MEYDLGYHWMYDPNDIHIYVYIYDICIIMMYHPRFGISLEYDGDIISLDIISDDLQMLLEVIGWDEASLGSPSEWCFNVDLTNIKNSGIMGF
jgi:hypothetical protein